MCYPAAAPQGLKTRRSRGVRPGSGRELSGWRCEVARRLCCTARRWSWWSVAAPAWVWRDEVVSVDAAAAPGAAWRSQRLFLRVSGLAARLSSSSTSRSSASRAGSPRISSRLRAMGRGCETDVKGMISWRWCGNNGTEEVIRVINVSMILWATFFLAFKTIYTLFACRHIREWSLNVSR